MFGSTNRPVASSVDAGRRAEDAEAVEHRDERARRSGDRAHRHHEVRRTGREEPNGVELPRSPNSENGAFGTPPSMTIE